MYRNKRQHTNCNLEIYRHKSQIRNAQHIQHNKYTNANNNNQWFEIQEHINTNGETKYKLGNIM